MTYEEIFISAPQNSLARIHTPLGDMVALADDRGLHMLQFLDYPRLADLVSQIIPRLKGHTISSNILRTTEKELQEYFRGERKIFSIRFVLNGTEFQKKAWDSLQKIPYGDVISYQQEALLLGQASACRAIGNANGKNPIVVMIPCHRVAAKGFSQNPSDKYLGGYSCGLDRKKHLLALEGVF